MTPEEERAEQDARFRTPGYLDALRIPAPCVHGITGRCAICRIDRRERLGAATTERILAAITPFVSGVCETSIEHERCRMIGCECRCHGGTA